MTGNRPQDVGILALQVYFPRWYVEQSELEVYDNVPPEKYTVGLGQQRMAAVGNNEDINSMCLTAVQNLLDEHEINPNSIGRIEVGTETVQDKSKSVKTYLMQLFPHNSEIWGVDVHNACYGGTAALLNTVAWMESCDWDGRLAIVVAGDIAVYEKGVARPTGGAGVVAMLIGPNAPIVFERGTAATHMEHVFDFYKPDPTSEYPTVDGPASIACYLRSLDICYVRHIERVMALLGLRQANLTLFDHIVCHAPYAKLVQKSISRLLFNDFMRNPQSYPELEEYRKANPQTSGEDRNLGRLLTNLSRVDFEGRALAGQLIPRQLGNSYCASLYMGLASLLCTVPMASLVGKRIGMFSYGSGAASTMFSLLVRSDPSGLLPRQRILQMLLEERIRIDPQEYVRLLEEREQLYCASDWVPLCSTSDLWPGTFYLARVDDLRRRYYARKVAKDEPE